MPVMAEHTCHYYGCGKIYKSRSKYGGGLCSDCIEKIRLKSIGDRPIAALQKEIESLKMQLKYCQADAVASMPVYGDSPPPIPPDMLARLIRLCHPDKNQNSKASTMASTWLLSQRQ